ncbi:MAG TPA: VWA domain-containing protein [Polyangiales bacterium]|nr:VWA domain-containing protein [Polyangiales bacterium]
MSAVFSMPYPLGLLGLLALPLLWWLHRHVVRAERREVSCLALWVDRELVRHEGAQRQRVPDRVVLALELLAALALCALLAGLDFAAAAAPRPTVGLVLDGSASMAGGEPGARPLDQVRAKLAELARERSGLYVSIVLAAERPDLLGERVMSAAAADRLLAELEPRGSACNLPPALELMSALGVDAQSTWLFSDDPELEHPRLVRVGKPSANAAIVHADWRPGEAPFVVLRRFELNASSPSSRDASLPVRLQLEIDGTRQSTTVQVPREGGQPFQLPVGESARKVVVSLPDDALAFDNRVSLLRPLERRVTVRSEPLSKPLERALAHALQAIPKLQASPDASADLVVRENPSGDAHEPSLVFLTRGAAPARFAAQPLADPFAAMLSGFDGRDLLWFAFERAPMPGARVLLQADPQPLIWQHGPSVFVNADLEQSNLLAHATFPIMLANLADERDRARGGLPRSNFRQGERLRFEPPRAWQSEIAVQSPSGKSWRFERGQPVELGLLSEPGEYALRAGGERQGFSVQLLAEAESELRLRKPATSRLPEIATSARAPGETQSRLRVPLLGLLLLACMAAYWLLAGGGWKRAARA